MKRYFKAVLVIVLTGLSFFAQNSKEVLTNEKIIEMFNLGLGEDIIIAKIRQSKCDCPADADSLIKLKKSKMPNAVILEIVNSANQNYNGASAVPLKSTLPNDQENNEILSQLKEPGIYINDNGALKLIEPSVFSGTKSNFLLGAVTYGIKKTKMRATVRGKTANTVISSSNPEFYFVFNPELSNSGAMMGGLFWGMPASSPAEFVMVQMKIKDNSREATIGEIGIASVSTGTSDKEVREYKFEKLRPGLYKVIPKQNLAVGEYCFYFASNVTGIGLGGGKVFDFSVKN